MVSPDHPPPQAATTAGIEPLSSPRISFSTDCLEDADDFISINLLSNKVMNNKEDKMDLYPDFEFLSNDRSGPDMMITADELFYEGKLLPFWQMHHSDKLKKISLKTRDEAAAAAAAAKEESNRVSNWFVDDDPSPRPPNCTVLWKELLRLKKKQRASTLSPSPSSSSSSLDMISVKEDNARNSKPARTKSATVTRIRPMVNVPICKTQGGRISSLPPLIPPRKARVDR